jgi:GNAT superfamily N-acetyltransferase
MIPDGYTDLALGKIAAVVTYLEMTERPQLPSAGKVHLRRIFNPDLEWYRNLFRRAGAQWLWFSRLEMHQIELEAVLNRSTTELYVAEHNMTEIGLVELDRSKPPDVEVASFALFADAIGKGLGRDLMTETLRAAWDEETRRVWLHTCTLDSPQALGFYRKCGFRPYKRAIEVADDPRLRGLLPEDAAPQVPIIR